MKNTISLSLQSARPNSNNQRIIACTSSWHSIHHTQSETFPTITALRSTQFNATAADGLSSTGARPSTGSVVTQTPNQFTNYPMAKHRKHLCSVTTERWHWSFKHISRASGAYMYCSTSNIYTTVAGLWLQTITATELGKRWSKIQKPHSINKNTFHIDFSADRITNKFPAPQLGQGINEPNPYLRYNLEWLHNNTYPGSIPHECNDHINNCTII